MINASKMYSEVELTTDIMTASSHRLIELLFNKYMQKLELAKNFILNKDYISKSQSIQRAFEILQYLRNCLNYESTRSLELVKLLDSIYEYAQKQLLEADRTNEVACIEEARKIISEVKMGWEGIKNAEKAPA